METQDKNRVKMWLAECKENIKARIYAKKFCIYQEKIVERGNNGYFVYNGRLYFGDRWFIFFTSHQNSWYIKQSGEG